MNMEKNGNESNSTNALQEAKMQLENLKEMEKPIIQSIQEKIDESAKEMAIRNAEHQKQTQELEEKYQKEMAKMKSKNLEENANFAKEMASLKEQLKEKINWKQVDLVMGKKTIDNCWNSAKVKDNSISISTDGLNATKHGNGIRWQSVFAAKEFSISVVSLGRPVLYYFEITNMSPYIRPIVGLSSGNIPNGRTIGYLPNSYAIGGMCDDYCLIGDDFKHDLLSGKHPFEWPNGAIKPEWNGRNCPGDVLGCGILLSSKNNVFIFFTGNGVLMGKQIPINPTVNALYPTVSLFGGDVSVEANFGDDSAKPFKYDIKKCPGLVFE